MQPLARVLTLVVLMLAVPGSLVVAGTQTAPQHAADSALVQQPVVFNNPLVYIGRDGNVYMTDEISGEGQPITGDSTGGPKDTYPFFGKTLAYGQFAWSPSGNMLAFVERTSKALIVVESGKGSNTVSRGVDSGFPPSFSPNGNEVAYVVQTGQKANEQDQVLQIQAIPPTGGAARAVGTLIGTSWSCGGDMFDPADMLYYGETGVLGDSPMFFAWLGSGYLHSMGCNGLGLALSNGTQDVWQNPNLQNAALLPDHTQLLAVFYDPSSRVKQLNLVEIGTGKLTPINTQPNLDRAVFSSDGQTIIYSTVEAFRTTKGNPDSPVGKQLFDPFWPAVGNDNGIFMWTVPVAGGSSTMIYKELGRGIGYISAARDRPSVAFSLTTSLAGMIDGINAGEPANQVLELAPHSDVLSVPVDGSAAPPALARGSQPSYGPVEQFTIIPAQPGATELTPGAPPTLAPPPTVPPTPLLPTPPPAVVAPVGGVCPGFLPSRLAIGGKGRVLPGVSNRLRDAPATGTILANIPAGGVFDVLEGPICMSNAIAWWKVNYAGTIGWTAEGQASTYWVEPYTEIVSPPAFSVTSVVAAVSPASSTTCPTTFNFSAVITVSGSGTVTYRWERSDGASGPVQSLTFDAPGSKIVSTQWALGAAGTHWERVHVLTPNDLSSNQATFSLTCAPAAFQVTAVAAAVSPASSTTCPSTFNFSGVITTNAAGTVTYQWERSDGASAPVQSLTFDAPGSKTVTTQWTLGAVGTRWERVHVLTPNNRVSNQATFSLTCAPAAFQVTAVTAAVSPASSTTCPSTFNFSGVITANAAGTVTYQWERSDGASAPVQSLAFTGPGSKTVTTQWTLGAAGTRWERLHILTPNNRVSGQATFSLTCAPAAFQVTAVAAAVSPASSTTCPSTFNFSGVITANAAGTVTYQWERSDGASALVQSLTFTGPGSKTVTTQWTLGAAGTRWEHLHVLTPNNRVSNQATFSLTCTPVAFQVTSVSAGVSPGSSTACPTTFNFSGVIKTNAAGTVTYRWERSDGASGPVQSLTFSGPGSKSVTTQWKLSAAGTRWERLHILTPNNRFSNQATFSLTCP